MLNIPYNVRQDIIRLIPSSVTNEISCFVYYDNHPRDSKTIDIIICTKSGEIKEFYQREVVCEMYLGRINPTEIKILRNNECDLFYIIVAEDQIIVLSRKEELCIHKKVDNVESYDIGDSICQGQACLKILRKDDAVPLIFDEKMENLLDSGLLYSNLQVAETQPILTHLNRKLTEAKYSVRCNESTYKEFMNLHQLAAFSMYQKQHPNLKESVFKSGCHEMANAFGIKTYTPWVGVCNKKIVIILNIINKNKESIENVQILLHVKNRPSVTYISKIYERIEKSPFWKHKSSHTVKTGKEAAIVTTIDLKEVKERVISRIDFSTVMVYKKEKEYILPFDGISMSALDVMGVNFDVLSSCEKLEDYHNILAVLATTERNDLILRHIKKEGDSVINVPESFCTHLQMELIHNTNNVLIHRKSPYHPLNGLMIIFPDNLESNHCYEVSLHTRSKDQVLAFIHYAYDALPYKLIITTSSQTITSKTVEYAQYNEENDNPQEIDYKKYAKAMLNQNAMLIEHLDTCMVKMNDTKLPEVKKIIGTQIDLFAAGVSNYTELRRKMLNEELEGIKQINKKCERNDSLVDTECMAIDI